jgi:serine/threonine protein phosphatase PrpC
VNEEAKFDMNARLRTAVDSFSLISGALQEQASNLSAFEQSALVPDRRGRGNLYVLVETIGGFPDHAQVQQQIIQVAQEYFRTAGSITAGIRTAIKTANAKVFDANLNASREQRGVAGLTLMVLKDRDAYIGQLGPALLYHIAKGEFRRLPTESTWLSSETLEDVDTDRQPPLGLRREVEPELSHLYVRDGDLLILASTLLAKLATDDQVRSAVSHRGATSVCESLQALARGEDVSALVVDVLAVGEGEVGARPADAERPSLWTRVASGLRESLHSGPTDAPPQGVGTGAEGPLASEEQATAVEEEEGWEEEEAETAPWAIDLRGAAQSVLSTVSGVGRGLATLLARVLPEAEPGQRAKRQQARRAVAPAAHGERKWLWVAVLIPVLVIAIFALTRYQYERSRQMHFRQLRETAQEAKTSAQISTSLAEQRVKIAQALAALDEALLLKPGDAETLAAREELSNWLDRINRVSRLFYFNVLKEFPDTETDKSQLGTTIVRGIDVYVLDLGMNRVYKYLLNETRDAFQVLDVDPVLLRKGDQHSEITVEDLMDIAWAESTPALGSSALFILDKKGHVLKYDPAVGRISAFPTADSSAWRNPVAMTGYLGRLYLLDPGANRVLKYLLTSTGYGGPPTDYLQTDTAANIADAVDLAIDGNVYVLHLDGRISKYSEGASVAFPQQNLDEPLKAPSCIFVTGAMDESGSVYVADAGNSRIVQFSKAGEFIRQFRSRDPGYMDGLRGLFVDEAGKKLYLVGGNKLYLVTLPD